MNYNDILNSQCGKKTNLKYLKIFKNFASIVKEKKYWKCFTVKLLKYWIKMIITLNCGKMTNDISCGLLLYGVLCSDIKYLFEQKWFCYC